MLKPVTVDDIEYAGERGHRPSTAAPPASPLPPPPPPTPHPQLGGQSLARDSVGAAAVAAWDLRLVMEYCELVGGRGASPG
jgi:hypothetical protein